MPKNKVKFITAAAAVLGAFALVFASGVEASPAKKKSTHKRATVTQNVNYNFACEGRVATIVSNALAGTNRDENAISFLVSMNTAYGVATIMRPSGSRMIKAGRYAMFRSDDGVSISIDWVDNYNVGQVLVLSFGDNGTFQGSSRSSQPTNVGLELFRSFLGSDYAPIVEYNIRHNVEGSCWQQ